MRTAISCTSAKKLPFNIPHKVNKNFFRKTLSKTRLDFSIDIEQVLTFIVIVKKKNFLRQHIYKKDKELRELGANNSRIKPVNYIREK